MDKEKALDKISEAIGSILDEFETSAYKDGKTDCKDEMQKEVEQARGEGYDRGYDAGYAAKENEQGGEA